MPSIIMVIKITQDASETYDIILTVLAYISMQSNVWKDIINVYKKKDGHTCGSEESTHIKNEISMEV